MRYRLAFCFLLFSFYFYSCTNSFEYKKAVTIEKEIWSYQDSIQFDFAIQDTTKIYNLYLDIKHSTAYEYQNLYTLIKTVFPQGNRLKEQLSLELAGKGGVWNGKCNKQSCHLSIPIQQNAYFNQIGDYQIVLEQFMRMDNIAGIQQITFKLEDTGQRR